MSKAQVVNSVLDDEVVVRPRLWRAGLGAGFAAATATTIVAALAHGAGVSPEIDGQAIPLAGFPQMTLLGAILGLLLAKGLSRKLIAPRKAFIATTLILLTLSFVPDLLIPATTGTRVILMFTHVVAAAIIIPVLARRLARY